MDNQDRINETSRKTYAFVNNIAHLAETCVTIDIWHLRACFNKTMGSVGAIAYKQIEKITIELAKEVGLPPYQYQAIVWGSIRNSFNK